MTVTETKGYTIEINYKPTPNKVVFIGYAECYEEADHIVTLDAAKYFNAENQRDTSNYHYTKECEDARDDTDGEMCWSNVTEQDVIDYLSEDEPPMLDGEFHRWANPSV